MSNKYDNFLKRLNATGNEYGQGFDHSFFEGMTFDELNKVKKVLELRAYAGDLVAIDAIVLLDREWTEGVLKKVTKESLQESAVCAAALGLFSLTQDTQYLDKIISLLVCENFETRWLCVQSLCSIDVITPKIKAVLLRVILEEEDEILRHSAAKKILETLGLRNTESAYRLEIRNLINKNIDVRKEAIARLLGEVY